ncbi:unnamed protein product [Rhizophagus irregularis]|nr:unnamed protein product [Rhizophagus irregularis]
MGGVSQRSFCFFTLGTGSWTSISAWNSGNGTGSWTSISAWNSRIGRTPGLQFQPGSLEWDRFLDFNFGLELWNGTGSWTSILAWNSGMDSSGLQNQNWRSLELAKEWGSSGLWNWRRMGDFRISETNTYEFLLEILADYTIRRFVGSSVFGSGLLKKLVQVFLSAWELRNDDLQSGTLWIPSDTGFRFRYSKDPKRQSGFVELGHLVLVSIISVRVLKRVLIRTLDIKNGSMILGLRIFEFRILKIVGFQSFGNGKTSSE